MDRSIEQDGRTPDRRPSPDPRSLVGRGDDPRQTPAPSFNDQIARLRNDLDRFTQDRPTMSQLIDRLQNAGIRAVPSLQTSGRLNGMSYEFDGIRIKGSDVGRGYTALGLQRRKGVQYDPGRDNLRLQEALRQARENPVAPLRHVERRPRENRRREYDGLSLAQRAALWEIGRFRTLLAADFIRIQYQGNRNAWRRDSYALASKKLIEQRSVVIATHSKTHGHLVKELSVVVLTKRGKDLMRHYHKDTATALQSPRQALYAGLVKPREIPHDAAIYRMYHAEAGHIEQQGGRIKRVVLDFELKKRAYSPLAKAQKLGPLEYAKKQAEVAQENGLKVVEGKMRFPDLRIEYETAAGELAHVDLELATEHYRGDHMEAKDRAGFKIYADPASFPPGGSYGRSRSHDEDHMIEVFSF
jgi:hypothetical protein